MNIRTRKASHPGLTECEASLLAHGCMIVRSYFAQNKLLFLKLQLCQKFQNLMNILFAKCYLFFTKN